MFCFVRDRRTNREHIHSFWSKKENFLGLRGCWKLLRGWECRACGQRGSSYWQFSARSIPRSYWMCLKQNPFLVFFNESKVTIITTNQILVSCLTQLKWWYWGNWLWMRLSVVGIIGWSGADGDDGLVLLARYTNHQSSYIWPVTLWKYGGLWRCMFKDMENRNLGRQDIKW